jgi:hypothetical protein
MTAATTGGVTSNMGMKSNRSVKSNRAETCDNDDDGDDGAA